MRCCHLGVVVPEEDEVIKIYILCKINAAGQSPHRAPDEDERRELLLVHARDCLIHLKSSTPTKDTYQFDPGSFMMAEVEDQQPSCLSPGFVDDVVNDAATGSDALLQGMKESMSGAFGWLFAQDKDTASAELQPTIEDGCNEAQREVIAEAPAGAATIDENTIAIGDAAVNADADKAAEPTKPGPITSSDTDVSNSSAASGVNNNKERGSAQPKSRAKLICAIAVGLVLVIAIVVGAVLGASGNQSKSKSIQQMQGGSSQNVLEDSYPSENDGGGTIVIPGSPTQSSLLPTARPSFRPTAASADQVVSGETVPPPIDAPLVTSDETTVSTAAVDDDTLASFSFYVMGDVPYNPSQQVIVQDQIIHLSQDVTDEDLFLIHVGDAMNAKQGCNEKDFIFTRDLLTSELPHLPCFIIPGDNDWNDCPNRNAAWKLWEKHFLGFEEKHWNGTDKFAPFQGSVVQRQSIRKENFAFVIHGVLFFSLHWLGGGKDSRTAARMIDNDAWIGEQARKHEASIESGRIRAVIIFGHALTKSDLSLISLQVIKDSFGEYNVPVIFFKGDKHTFEVCESFLGIGWDNFKIVQVDQGGNAPPLRVSILGEDIGSSSSSKSNATIVLTDFIHLDRRGGVYSWAPDQLPNACGAVSRGEVY